MAPSPHTPSEQHPTLSKAGTHHPGGKSEAIPRKPATPRRGGPSPRPSPRPAYSKASQACKQEADAASELSQVKSWRPDPCAPHIKWSPERRLLDKIQLTEHKVVSKRGEKLVPYRIHEPASHSQYMAQGLYEKFKLVEEHIEINGPPKQDAHALEREADFAAASLPPALLVMPGHFGLTPDIIAREAIAAESKAEAAVALILGRSNLKLVTRSLAPEFNALQRQLREGGHVDVKAWVRLGSAADSGRDLVKRGTTIISEFIQNQPMVEKVLISIALLYNVEKVSSVDISNMGLKQVPVALGAYPGLRRLNMSQNRPLRSLADLPSSLEAIDLCGCMSLDNVRPLGALSRLKAVDLSCCESLIDVGPLLSAGYLQPKEFQEDEVRPQKLMVTSPPGGLEGLLKSRARALFSLQPPDTSEQCSRPKSALAMHSSGAMTERLSREGNRTLMLQEVVPVCHPVLRWLCLSGCTDIKHGLDLIPKCEALSFVDLFECHSADPATCLKASESLKTFVWPSVDMLGEHAQAKAVPKDRLTEMLLSACAAVDEKCRLAAGSVKQEWLPQKTKQAANAALQAAHAAAADLGLTQDHSADFAPPKSIFAEVEAEPDEEVIEAKSWAWAKVNTMSRRQSIQQMGARDTAARGITPLSLSKGMYFLGFKARRGMQLTDIFRVLDRDRDGLLMLEDLEAFAEQGQVTEVDLAVGALLCRHHGGHDAVAANLAAKRTEIDRSRITECMIIAGVDENVARRSSKAIAYCAASISRGLAGGHQVKDCLEHALSPFAIAYAASLVGDFKTCLEENFGDCTQAFSHFDRNGNALVSWQEFKSASEIWPRSKEPGVLEVLFRILNRRGNRLTWSLEPRDFEVLKEFDAERILDAMERAGRGIISYPKERPHRLRQFDLDASSVQDDQIDMSRTTFCNCWHDMQGTDQTDAKTVFNFLDTNSDNRIGRRHMLILCDAMTRRGEVEVVTDMVCFLNNHFGNLQAAYDYLQKASKDIGKEEKTKDKGKQRRKSVESEEDKGKQRRKSVD